MEEIKITPEESDMLLGGGRQDTLGAAENVSESDTSGGGVFLTLTEKEAHCVARLLQGAVFGERGNVLDGCAFCKFQCNMKREEGEIVPHFDEILQKLGEATGVDLTIGFNRDHLLHSKFKYKKFLKNSNEDIKEFFRNYFSDI